MPPCLPLSAVLITKDAAASLPACLAALKFCDEILVVDSGSRDATLDIARTAGARLIEAEWRGFGPMKQFAVEQATHDWVLCIDADEIVSERLQNSIRETLAAVSPAPTFAAWRCARRNRFLGRYLHYGEGYPDWSLRLFDRRHARWSNDAVHEKVLTDTAIGTLAGDLLHDSAETIASYLDKQNRYTSLAATAAIAAGKRASAGHLLLSPLFRFIKFYLVRRGFQDGLPGLVHILIGCQNSLIKYAKMIELQRKKQEPR